MLDTLIQTPMNEHIAHDHVKNPTVFSSQCRAAAQRGGRAARARARRQGRARARANP